jgi:hypothetical protein
MTGFLPAAQQSAGSQAQAAVVAVSALILLVGLFYAGLRFAAGPALNRFSRSAALLVDLVAVGLLLPEYLCTRLMRRATGRPAPFAHAYGDAVCGAAGAAHWCVSLVGEVLHAALKRLTPRWALALAVFTALWIVRWTPG